MKIKVSVSVGLVGCKRQTEFEIPDDEAAGMSDSDIDDLAKNEMFNMIEWNWWKV
jgi:hypothetical protein